MIPLAPAFLLYALACPPGPTCSALPISSFRTWGMCEDARLDAKRNPDVVAVCIRRGAEYGEPVE